MDQIDLPVLLEIAQEIFFEEVEEVGEGEVEEFIGNVLNLILNDRRVPIPTINNYVELVVHRMTDQEFKSHFRVLPATFEYILRLINEDLQRAGPDGNPVLSAEKQLLVALWRMATPDCYRSIKQRFGIGKATAVRSVRRVQYALSSLAPMIITWPSGDRLRQVINGFQRTSGFPGTIGAVDGTHINIPSPKVDPGAYVNRKNHHSLQMQAVCDYSLRFTNCYIGEAGSVHDARVYRLSRLKEYASNPAKFPGNTHLIGDAAYPLEEHLLTPFVDNGRLTNRQKNFNYCHSSTRMAIERAFGMLKIRWRSLLDKLAMRNLDVIPYHILACCVLHNLCLMRNDDIPEELYNVQVVGGNADRPAQHYEPVQRAIAVAKRQRICQELEMLLP